MTINSLDLLKFLAIISVIIYHGTLFDYNIVSSHTANTYFSFTVVILLMSSFNGCDIIGASL